MLERPKELQERVFKKLFEQAEIAMFTDKEYSDYEESLHNLWDITNAMSDAEEKGFGKGKEEGRAEGAKAQAIETARLMKQHGDDLNYIASVTHLPISEIENL